MIELAAFAAVYLILVVIFWWQVKRAAAYWWNRDITEQMLPKPRHVHHTEKLLGIRTRPKPKESASLALLSEYGKRGRNH